MTFLSTLSTLLASQKNQPKFRRFAKVAAVGILIGVVGNAFGFFPGVTPNVTTEEGTVGDAAEDPSEEYHAEDHSDESERIADCACHRHVVRSFHILRIDLEECLLGCTEHRGVCYGSR